MNLIEELQRLVGIDPGSSRKSLEMTHAFRAIATLSHPEQAAASSYKSTGNSYVLLSASKT